MRVGKVILLAPPFGDSRFDPEGTFYQNFQIDPRLPSRTKDVTVFYSTNDKPEYEAAHKLKEAVSTITLKSFIYGHFISKDMNGRTQFPELLNEIFEN